MLLNGRALCGGSDPAGAARSGWCLGAGWAQRSNVLS